jgi:multidrug efflux system membrane fusion protein
LKAVFDNQNNALFPNQFVNVRLLVDVLKNTVVIPASTIQRGSQGTFVYVVNEDQTAALRSVTIKNTEGNDVALASGVEAGEMVVLEGMDKIQDGARVDVQVPSQNGDGFVSRRGNGNRGRGEGHGRRQRDNQCIILSRLFAGRLQRPC